MADGVTEYHPDEMRESAERIRAAGLAAQDLAKRLERVIGPWVGSAAGPGTQTFGNTMRDPCEQIIGSLGQISALLTDKFADGVVYAADTAEGTMEANTTAAKDLGNTMEGDDQSHRSGQQAVGSMSSASEGDDRTNGQASGGNDRATVYASRGNDRGTGHAGGTDPGRNSVEAKPILHNGRVNADDDTSAADSEVWHVIAPTYQTLERKGDAGRAQERGDGTFVHRLDAVVHAPGANLGAADSEGRHVIAPTYQTLERKGDAGRAQERGERATVQVADAAGHVNGVNLDDATVAALREGRVAGTSEPLEPGRAEDPNFVETKPILHDGRVVGEGGDLKPEDQSPGVHYMVRDFGDSAAEPEDRRPAS